MTQEIAMLIGAVIGFLIAVAGVWIGYSIAKEEAKTYE